MHAFQRFFTKIDLNVVQFFCGERHGLNDLQVGSINDPLSALVSIEMMTRGVAESFLRVLTVGIDAEILFAQLDFLFFL